MAGMAVGIWSVFLGGAVGRTLRCPNGRMQRNSEPRGFGGALGRAGRGVMGWCHEPVPAGCGCGLDGVVGTGGAWCHDVVSRTGLGGVRLP